MLMIPKTMLMTCIGRDPALPYPAAFLPYPFLRAIITPNPTRILPYFLENMKEQVTLRQSTEDVESIMKQLHRADLMVTNRLATLRSWLDGEGVTVQGKKHHTVTTTVEPKNLLEKKTWCFDGFVNETKKEDLKDIVERDETAKFDQV